MKKAATSTAFEAAYTNLNDSQKNAVDAIEGPVMVVAGPGTGKTQILTLRIANILLKTDARPENILALTFTNSGVRAMRERLRSYIGDEAYRVGIYTFHSFAEHILQQYRSYFPEREFASVITDLEKVKTIEGILTKHDFSEIVSTYDRFSSLKQVKDAIDDIKQEGISPAEFESRIPAWEQEMLEDESMFYKRATGKYKVGDVKPTELKKVEKRVAKARELATAYTEYQREIAKMNRYDFSDMILSVLSVLEKDENLKLDLQEQYQYVLVDEHQDTNEGQNMLVEFLTDAEHLDGRPNLFTVGDEKQSIYRFQGASDKAFAHFKEHYNDVEVIELTENYRSTSAILDASHELITNSLPKAQQLSSNTNVNPEVEVREFSDYKFELLYITKDIEAKLKDGIDPSNIAIIYRSNKHLKEIKSLFQQFTIPYQVLSRDTLLDDPSILMLVALIRVIHNPFDDASLGRLLFADFLKFDSMTVSDTLRSYRKNSRNGDVGSLIEHLRADQTYGSLTTLISDMKTYDANHHFRETFKELLHVSGYLNAALSASDSRTFLRKIEILFNEMLQQSDRQEVYSAKDFIDFIDATLAYNLNIEVTATSVGSGVQCMTAHGSKGLEFEHVYLMNTARTNWENSRGFASIALPLERYAGELDDERRLFYVAVTRAKNHLLISSSKQDWYGKAMEPSQFISELGEQGISKIDVSNFEQDNQSELIRFFSNDSIDDSIFSVDYLAARFAEENLSVTSLNNYIDCPLKYLFRNLIHLPDVYTAPLRYGDAVHRALEAFFKKAREAGKIGSRKALLDAYEEAMKTSGFYGDEYETFLLKGRQSLGMYYDYYAKDWVATVALEEYIRCTLETKEGTITLSGMIDKLEFLDEIDHGPVRVVDYKTGKVYSQKSSKAQKEALERQIQFYHLLLRDYKDGDVVVKEAVLDFVEPTEEGVFEQKTLEVTNEDLTVLTENIEQLQRDVKDGSFLSKGCRKKDCEWCTFWDGIDIKTKTG